MVNLPVEKQHTIEDDDDHCSDGLASLKYGEWEDRPLLEDIPEYDHTFEKDKLFTSLKKVLSAETIRTRRYSVRNKYKDDETKYIDWKNKGLYEIEYQVRKFEHEEGGEKPTVREIFYRLEAKGLIVKTEWAYNTYDDRISEAIKVGWLPPDLFADDDSRPDIEEWDVWFPEEWVDDDADKLESAVDQYNEPIWYNQPKYVLVVTEKAALKSALERICDPLQVGVMANRGWAGLRKLYSAYKKMLRQQRGPPGDIPKEIVILYVGDLDPSGWEMSRDFQRRLHIFNKLNEERGDPILEFTFKRIAVTPEQASELGLNWIPLREIKDKLLGVTAEEAALTGKKKKDPDTNAAAYIARFTDFVEQHRHEVEGIKTGNDKFSQEKDKIWFPVLELEAVTSLKRDYFRKLVKDSILKHYDKQIWKENKHNFDRRLVVRRILECAREIADRFEDKGEEMEEEIEEEEEEYEEDELLEEEEEEEK
jgi:hypothetical protein